jgi:hypothetical protein
MAACALLREAKPTWAANTAAYARDSARPSEGEPLAEESLGLLKGYSRGKVQLFVPDLFWPELGNVLWKAVRLGRISQESAAESITSLFGLGIPTSPSGPLLGDAFSIAVNFQRSVYDAVYLARGTIEPLACHCRRTACQRSSCPLSGLLAGFAAAVMSRMRSSSHRFKFPFCGSELPEVGPVHQLQRLRALS